MSITNKKNIVGQRTFWLSVLLEDFIEIVKLDLGLKGWE